MTVYTSKGLAQKIAERLTASKGKQYYVIEKVGGFEVGTSLAVPDNDTPEIPDHVIQKKLELKAKLGQKKMSLPYETTKVGSYKVSSGVAALIPADDQVWIGGLLLSDTDKFYSFKDMSGKIRWIGKKSFEKCNVQGVGKPCVFSVLKTWAEKHKMMPVIV